MGMQGKMLQPFAMQTLVPNAALGIEFSRGTVFFPLVLVYPSTGYRLREVTNLIHGFFVELWLFSFCLLSCG